MRRNADAWGWATPVWAIAVVGVAVVQHLTLAQFLMGIVLPVLPAALDVIDLWTATRASIGDRSNLADVLDSRLDEWPDIDTTEGELRGYLDQLYRLRRDGPLVPDFL